MLLSKTDVRSFQSKTARGKYYILSKKNENKNRGKKSLSFILVTLAKIFLDLIKKIFNVKHNLILTSVLLTVCIKAI